MEGPVSICDASLFASSLHTTGSATLIPPNLPRPIKSYQRGTEVLCLSDTRLNKKRSSEIRLIR